MRRPDLSGRPVAGLLVLGCALLAACGGTQTTAPPSSPTVASIVVTPAADTLTALGQTSQLTAVAKDASGATLSGATIVWSSAAPGTVSVDSASGLATALANGTATITASAGGQSAQVALTVAQAVAGVTVTPGSASLAALGATEAFSAAAVDANNNAVTNVTFLWVSSDPTVATVDTTGLATAKKAGTATITAAARGVPGNAVLTVTQTAKQLAFTIQPSNATAGEALSPAIQVTIEDSTGARVPDATDAITLALSPNSGGGMLGGTKTVNAVDGVATFSGLWIDKAAAGYGLQATAGGLTTATSTTFTIAAAAAARLAFSAEPTDATAGVALSPAVAVTVEDLYGNTVPGATNSVTVALGANPGGGTLLGTTTVSAASGVASFSGLSIQRAGSGYTLVASSGVLATATSTAFAITPAAVAQVVFKVQPSQAQGSDPIAPAVAVAVEDAFGNTVAGATNAVTLSIGANAGRGTLSGTTTVNAVNGIATFPTVAIDQPGIGYTLVATTSAISVGTISAKFNVVLTFAVVKTGTGHSCGLTTSGAAYCWGDNSTGELGDNSTASHLTPVAVRGSLRFTSLTTGSYHTCALTGRGAAYCWGANGEGQVGKGTSEYADSTPQAVSGGLTFGQVSAGGSSTCAVTTGGSGYCWGFGTLGQLGDNTTSSSTTPVAVAGGLTFATISPGDNHTCGVVLTGAGYCWGNNLYGQLGNNSTASDSTPQAVVGGLLYTTISSGQWHTCGVATNGHTYCWGANPYGQLGDNSTKSDSVPNFVGGVTTGGLAFTAVPSRASHTCGLTTAGAAYCWGNNLYGQLGDGTSSDDSLPVAVSGGLTFGELASGDSRSCGVTVAGVGYCWGKDDWGQLGDGTTGKSAVPVKVFGQP